MPEKWCVRRVSDRCSKTPIALVGSGGAGILAGMAWLFQPLLMLLARGTDSQLACQVDFLHAENQMLRRRVTKHVRLSGQEKTLLVKLGQAIGGRAVGVL